jgi:hypothetical protein
MPSLDACAEQRREVGARCGAARAAAQVHADAGDRARMLRRDLVAANHRVAVAQAAADPGPRRAEKDRARATFLAARETATTDAQRREVTAAWADAVDRVNRSARLAQRALVKARTEVTTLERALHEAERSEQAARIQAEAAEADCLDARLRLAACEERLLGMVAGGPAGASAPSSGPPGGATSISSGGGSGSAPATHEGSIPAAPQGPPGGANESGWPVGPTPLPRITAEPRPEPLVIESLVSGDRLALELAAGAVAEVGRASPAGVRAQLQELVDAIGSAAAAAGYLLFDEGHPFWANLSVSEARDVTAALARLGFRFEPAEGWHAGRAPLPSDLAMALAYAGLDARHVRGLPSAEELRALPASMWVDARAYLAAGAPDLAMDQLAALLGSSAARLGPLWDIWGLARPVLLGPRRSLGSLSG